MKMGRYKWQISTIFFAILAGIGWSKLISIKNKVDRFKSGGFENMPRTSQNERPMEPIVVNDDDVASVMSNERGIKDTPQARQQLLVLAQQIADQKISAYKSEERSKRDERVGNHMDDMESFFANAVVNYTESYDVPEETAEQLHLIIEDGFEKQRLLYEQMSNGDIEESEYHQSRQESRREDKQMIRDLLGEEGAEDFRDILREEREGFRGPQ